MKRTIPILVLNILLAASFPLKAQLSSIPYESGIYKISTPNHLKYLSIAVQNNETTEGKTFYLVNDIDMASINDFTPIGGSPCEKTTLYFFLSHYKKTEHLNYLNF